MAFTNPSSVNENKIFKLVHDNILELSKRTKYSNFSIIKKHPTNNKLKELQAKYFIPQIGKATYNVAFICQRFHA